MKRNEISPEFVTYVPATLEDGVLYISQKHKTAAHMCCCGCGNKVVTPLKPAGWSLVVDAAGVSLSPSVGSWSLPCRSHYFIRQNRIDWATQFSAEQIADVQEKDRIDRERHFGPAVRPGLWQRIVRWFRDF